MVALTDEFFDDPYSFYRLLRLSGPVHWVELPNGGKGWLVVNYDAACRVLADATVRKDLRAPAGAAAVTAGVAAGDHALYRDDPLFASMLFRDPPHHTMLRRALGPVFLPRTIGGLEPRIEAFAEELLTGLAGADTADLLADYAFPLPIAVICEMLGAPRRDHPDFLRWSRALMDVADPEARIHAGQQLQGYLLGLIDERRRDPRQDLISGLLHPADDTARLSDSDVLATATLLLVAGHETTANLIANAAAIALSDRELCEVLLVDEEALGAFVEEMLRRDSPVGMATMRYATEPMWIGGTEIRPGELIFVALGAAGRDPGQYSNPDTIDITRGRVPHIAFGHGIHHCLGTSLARMEARIALSALLRRFPGMTLDTSHPLTYRHSIVVRGLNALPVQLRPAAALHAG